MIARLVLLILQTLSEASEVSALHGAESSCVVVDLSEKEVRQFVDHENRLTQRG